jgi:radical SAM protein with 4Fe4S-binding SPASM domain
MDLKKMKNLKDSIKVDHNYDKNKSFLSFQRSKNNREKINTLIKKALIDKNLISSIDKKHVHIIKDLKEDLIENKKTINKIRFEISPNVEKEIELLDYKDLLKFLIHRYRYEIYPQTLQRDDYPPYLQIEPTSFCNFRCVFCFQSNLNFSGKKNGFMGHMTYDLFREIVDQVENKVEFISLASRGEPLICNDIEKMLAYTRNKFLNLKINTNASVLTESKIHSILQSGVKTIVFSADAADEQLYEKLRVNGSFKEIVENIKLFKLVREKHYPKAKIITRVSGVKVNQSQNFEDMKNFWNEVVDQVAFVDYCPWEDVYSSKKNDLKKPCTELWRRMYVWWDGVANPCEVDFKSSLSVGKIDKNDISSLWTSSAYDNLRKNHKLKLRKKIDPCNKCVVI